MDKEAWWAAWWGQRESVMTEQHLTLLAMSVKY